MKKIITAIFAVLIAYPAFANGYQSQGSSWQMFFLDPYIAIHGGISNSNLNYNYNDSKETLSDTIFQGRAAIGLDVNDTMRSEIEWSLYGKSNDSADFGDIENVKVETKLQTLLWNSYWEFGGYQIVRPFVGLGVGAAFTDVKREVQNIGNHSENKTRFSAMGTLGITFDMDLFAVDVAARYNYVDINSGLHNFGGDIGIRFMF